MADTLKRLSGPAALTTSAAAQYTVPGSTKAVVRNVHVCNESGSAATVTVSIGTDGAGKRILKGFSVPANGVYDWSGSLVLDAAEVVQALASANTSLTLTISGLEVT